MKGLAQWLAIRVIRLYQLCLSPLLPPACRFQPTCSQYALEAVQRFGVLKGTWLAVRRLAKCHPFHPGGFDPVPRAERTASEPVPAARPESVERR